MTLQEVWSLLNLYNSSFSGEQIDEAIGVILNGGISSAVEAAQQSAAAAAKSASEAAGSAASVGAAATNAQSAASRAAGSATEAESYAHGGTGKREGEDEDNARYYSEEAAAAAAAAAGSADSVAEDSAAAVAAASAATAAAQNAGNSAAAAADSAAEAKAAAGSIAGSVDAAAISATAAKQSETNAKASETAAKAAQEGAEAAKEAAEDAAQTLNSAQINAAGHLILTAPDGSTRDLGDVTGENGSSIQSIARTAGNGAPGTTDTYTVTLTDGSTTQFQVYNGKDGAGSGDMLASVYDPQGKRQDVFQYVDDAIVKIPAPDVSGQINTHNEDPNAHAAIRESIDTHIGDKNIHITADERTKWDAMLPASQKGATGGVASLGNDGKVPTGQLPATMPPSAHTHTKSQITDFPSTMPPSSHNHSASEITSGTLSVARGGSGKSSWAANRLIYPSASTTMAQLAFPTTDGSFLRQDKSGAPYWTKPADVLSAIGAATMSEVNAAISAAITGAIEGSY